MANLTLKSSCKGILTQSDQDALNLEEVPVASRTSVDPPP